jgi:glycosyltransferase involved in cell wall biosynthesis
MSANKDNSQSSETLPEADGLDVTVVIAAFNAESTIAGSVNSVSAIGPWPVVVVDDGSTDGTASIAAAHGARVIRQENKGASLARSAGLAVAETELVIFLDSDDSLLPGAVTAARLLSENPSVGVVGGLITPNSASRPELLQPQRSLPEQLDTRFILNETYSPWPQSAAIWRRSSLMSAEAENPPPLHPRFAEDFELLIRVSLISRVMFVHEHTCLHRLAGGKSATNAVEAVRQSERVRSYYASFLGFNVDILSTAGIEDQAAWRQFRASQSEFGLTRAFARQATQPRMLWRLIRHRWRRAMRKFALNRI